MNKGTNIKQIRKSGFRSRKRTVSGRRIIRAKRNKKRSKISL